MGTKFSRFSPVFLQTQCKPIFICCLLLKHRQLVLFLIYLIVSVGTRHSIQNILLYFWGKKKCIVTVNIKLWHVNGDINTRLLVFFSLKILKRLPFFRGFLSDYVFTPQILRFSFVHEMLGEIHSVQRKDLRKYHGIYYNYHLSFSMSP